MLTTATSNTTYGNSFPPTRLSVLQGALDNSETVRRAAVETFYKLYKKPITSYLKRSFRSLAADEEDLTQNFFLDKIIQGKLLTQFNKNRGRFRALLCTALKNYVRDTYKYHNAQCRNPGQPTTEISRAPEPQDDGALPDQILEFECVRETMSRALLRMHKKCAQDNREDFWYAFARRLAAPIYGYEPLSITEIAQDLNLPSNASASNLLINAQRRFRTALREEISTYAWNDAEIDREIQEFFKILSNSTNHGPPQ